LQIVGYRGFSSSGSVIRGLAIDRFNQSVRLVGGTADNRVEGNFIGTDPSGTLDLGNSAGVVVAGSSRNAIGGKTPAARNLVSGNFWGEVNERGR
jgi:hypothetical protein